MAAEGSTAALFERSQRLHQELLARRVASAKARHDAALAALQRTLAANQPNCAPEPDGWRGILEARFAEADALSEYVAALRAFANPPTELHVVKH